MPSTRIEADPAGGFHYPYFLHVPDTVAYPTILVEPTNMPGPTDDFDAHLREADRRASEGVGRRIADALGVPFLHPVFPRPRSDPVDWTHYTHQLCRRTLQIDSPPLARIDEQLVAMIDDARARLADQGHVVDPTVVCNGFSASGTFAHRFAALHPDRVTAVSAGGLNGMTVLPRTSAAVDRLEAPRTLHYPVGVADLEALTGTGFDAAAYREVHQFLYMGGADDSDTLRYPDAWTDPEPRLTAVLVYGEDIHADRFPYCQQVYDAEDVAAVFTRYPDAGHTPTPAVEDIIAFHRRTLEGEAIAAIRADLGGDVTP